MAREAAEVPGVRTYSARAFATKAPGINEGDVQKSKKNEQTDQLNIFYPLAKDLTKKMQG
jgi:hypothetical protein